MSEQETKQEPTFKTTKQWVDLLEISSVPDTIGETVAFLEKAKLYYKKRIGRMPRYFFCSQDTAVKLNDLVAAEKEAYLDDVSQDNRPLANVFKGMDIILVPYKKFTR